MPHQRRQVHFRGQVQGVGFRYTTRCLAARYAVTGFVQNLADGRVLVVAEGEAAELDAFLDALGQRMQRYIAGQDDARLPPTGEFSDFDVRF